MSPADERWDRRYRELEHFHRAHGHLNLPKGPLYSWLYQQTRKRLDGPLTPARAERLAAIDPLWFDEHASTTSDRTRGYFRLTDASWNQVREILPGSGGAAWADADHRQIIEAILWKIGTGARWNDLPEHLGSFNAIRAWYQQRIQDGTWQAITRRTRMTRNHNQPQGPST
ncbi:transposase [Catenulispora yoronensis]